MIDKALIQRMHDRGYIDKAYAIWWQLGFEGRHIFTEEEFNKRITAVKFKDVFDETGNYVGIDNPDDEGDPFPVERESKLWTGNDVPILLKDIEIGSENIPCFISVKPLSHEHMSLKDLENSNHDSIHILHQPHIRGTVIEKTERHLFWYPLKFGVEPARYQSIGRYFEKYKMWCIINPILPRIFYSNIIKNGWSVGRRPQKKPECMECGNLGYKIVPYFEFDPKEKHITIYPAKLVEGELDFPVVFKGVPEGNHGDILGIGYFFEERSYYSVPGEAHYWKLNDAKRNMAREYIGKQLNIELK